MQALAERPPYVQFETRAVPTNELTEAGTPLHHDVDFVLVTTPGGKDTFEDEASSWFARKANDVRDKRFPSEWLAAFREAYTAWKEDREAPVLGTKLSLWPGLSPSQYKLLTDFRIRTVEDVAAMNEDTMMRVGLGARSLKDRAALWLENAKGGLSAERLASALQENADLKTQIERLEARVASLAAAQQASPGQKL